MDPSSLTNQALIDLYRSYMPRHPNRGYLVMEMAKRGMLGDEAQVRSLHKAAAKGNVVALRDFYNSGAKGKIDWSKPGAYSDCAKLAGKFMNSEQAKGFCAERHHDSVGKWPGEKPK